MTEFALSRLYVIADAATLQRKQMGLAAFARELRAAGVGLVQLRDKTASGEAIVGSAQVLGRDLPEALLLLNDRAVEVRAGGAGGVHLGQTDMPVGEARRLLGPAAVIGISTHTDAEVVLADETSANYVAIGPVFATSTKADAAAVVGLEGVRRARALTAKPLVAIGGITRENCRSVVGAGADAVAVISALFAPGETVEQVARDFLRILR